MSRETGALDIFYREFVSFKLTTLPRQNATISVFPDN